MLPSDEYNLHLFNDTENNGHTNSTVKMTPRIRKVVLQALGITAMLILMVILIIGLHYTVKNTQVVANPSSESINRLQAESISTSTTRLATNNGLVKKTTDSTDIKLSEGPTPVEILNNAGNSEEDLFTYTDEWAKNLDTLSTPSIKKGFEMTYGIRPLKFSLNKKDDTVIYNRAVNIAIGFDMDRDLPMSMKKEKAKIFYDYVGFIYPKMITSLKKFKNGIVKVEVNIDNKRFDMYRITALPDNIEEFKSKYNSISNYIDSSPFSFLLPREDKTKEVIK